MQANKNRKAMLLLVAVFVLPVILAKLALDNQWFNQGVTNRGQLHTPPIALQPLMHQSEPLWQLVYVAPASCDTACDNALISIQQTVRALGRNSERVQGLLVLHEESDQRADTLTQLPTKTLSKNDVNQLFKDVSSDGIFIIDTQGNGVLSYPAVEQQQQAIMISRDMLADMRKLLKLSRIG